MKERQSRHRIDKTLIYEDTDVFQYEQNSVLILIPTVMSFLRKQVVWYCHCWAQKILFGHNKNLICFNQTTLI